MWQLEGNRSASQRAHHGSHALRRPGSPPGVHARPRSTSLASSCVTQMPARSPRLHACTGCLRAEGRAGKMCQALGCRHEKGLGWGALVHSAGHPAVGVQGGTAKRETSTRGYPVHTSAHTYAYGAASLHSLEHLHALHLLLRLQLWQLDCVPHPHAAPHHRACGAHSDRRAAFAAPQGVSMCRRVRTHADGPPACRHRRQLSGHVEPVPPKVCMQGTAGKEVCSPHDAAYPCSKMRHAAPAEP